MLRITRQADYGIILLTAFAREEEGKKMAANELAKKTALPGPTVIKILKLLTRGGLLSSHRGVAGGYELSRAPEEIDIVEVISVLDGPIGLTQCAHDDHSCNRESLCPVRPNWQRINHAVCDALSGITLKDMAEPPCPLGQSPLKSPISSNESILQLSNEAKLFEPISKNPNEKVNHRSEIKGIEIQ